MPNVRIGRLFLVGTPRSGTTLLQCLLAAHSQIASLPETNFFSQVEPTRDRLARLLRLASPNARRFYRILMNLIEVPADLRLPRYPIFVPQYGRLFTRIMDAWILQQGKSVWLEKTPGHLRKIDLIERYVPGARFIHLVRNGPDNIASLHEVTSKNPVEWTNLWNFEYCIQYWIDDQLITLRYVNKPNHLVLGYNQVVERTCETLQRACAFMGVPFEEQMLHSYKSVAEKVAPMTDYWRTGARETISNRNGTKFYEIFTQEQQQYILQRVAEVDLTPLGIL